MIKVEHIETFNFEGAIRGMRNPLNSWDKSDTAYDVSDYWDEDQTIKLRHYDVLIGDNDLDLMKRLYKAGPEHRKYLRQIFISLDITAPLYWWKEFDTYKVGTVSNSCSTMHKIAAKEFVLDDFSHEHLKPYAVECLTETIKVLNEYRTAYHMTHDKEAWWQLIQLLPSSYNQKRTITMNYENAITIIKQRYGHKLDEWNDLVDILVKELPYIEEIMEDYNE